MALERVEDIVTSPMGGVLWALKRLPLPWRRRGKGRREEGGGEVRGERNGTGGSGNAGGGVEGQGQKR